VTAVSSLLKVSNLPTPSQSECNLHSYIFASCRNHYFVSHYKIESTTVKTSVFHFPAISCCAINEGGVYTAEHTSNNFTLLRSKIRRLPVIHQATLKALVEHLARVVLHNDKNKMDTKNLAISFGTAIFGEDELPKGQNLLSVQSWKVQQILDNFCTFCHLNRMFHRILSWRT
jgi:hypothetical protein